MEHFIGLKGVKGRKKLAVWLKIVCFSLKCFRHSDYFYYLCSEVITDPTPAPPLHGRGVPADRLAVAAPLPCSKGGVPADRLAVAAPLPCSKEGVPADRLAVAAPLPCSKGECLRIGWR